MMIGAMDVGLALTLSAPHESEQARLAALDALMTGALGRPVPAPRWRALRRQISAELGRRALMERRSADSILRDEIHAAIMLASEAARLVAMRCFVESFSRELRLRTCDELLVALTGTHRTDGAQLERVDPDTLATSDSEAAELAHLWSRLPMLARLTASEVAALERELQGEVQTVASRQALSRARRKIRAIEK